MKLNCECFFQTIFVISWSSFKISFQVFSFGSFVLSCATTTEKDTFVSVFLTLVPVVRKAVSTNPGLKVKLGFDFSCTKAYIWANVLWGFILV